MQPKQPKKITFAPWPRISSFDISNRGKIILAARSAFNSINSGTKIKFMVSQQQIDKFA